MEFGYARESATIRNRAMGGDHALDQGTKRRHVPPMTAQLLEVGVNGLRGKNAASHVVSARGQGLVSATIHFRCMAADTAPEIPPKRTSATNDHVQLMGAGEVGRRGGSAVRRVDLA